ncbi:phosphate/phosphite/phosphonate ABC transporter substrate-binding protein [Actomonas aquatica]|uniref:PhnD/SsuA/transferrin family substrate-binding protein n=1 Tax=Actomonas aquatica TaxID=2866162 RepID=A0ABZ1C4Q2_9BACT|nr:PhnD/SsuA/transferrin family substrate-binding protein [Opitutus sp. WL0086]WRQ86446.1 PhnD/SsuA/transferrin family substrate-binding protein [Opitutus sp. WL0086]
MLLVFVIRNRLQCAWLGCGEAVGWCLTGRRLRLIGLGLCVALVGVRGEGEEAGEGEKDLVRFGFSQRLFRTVNSNDAHAAVRVWSNAILDGWGFQVSTNIYLFDTLDDLVGRVRNGQVEGIAVTLEEFWEVRDQIEVGPVLLGTDGEVEWQEFVVVARRDRGWTELADLRGRTLRGWDAPRTGLAVRWLTLELDAMGVEGGPEAFFEGEPSMQPKVSQVLLPVFFGQVDVGLVTRRSLELMAELNPQIGRDLVVLASSEPYIATLCFLRKDFDRPYLPKLLEALESIGDTVAGEQIVTLFQQSGLTVVDASELDSSLALMDRYEAWREREAKRRASAESF